MSRAPFDVSEEEMELSRLAMRFRHDRDESVRREVAAEYAKVVDRLIASGTWNEIPSPEDQLPDDYMPKAFDDYWYK